MKRPAWLLACLVLTACCSTGDGNDSNLGSVASSASESTTANSIPLEAIRLRNLGYAELENEAPGEAAAHFSKLVEVYPQDPLGWADLAIAELRQQRSDEALAAITKALELAPDRGDLAAIRGEVLAWSGRTSEALGAFRAAAESAPDDPEILYSLYRLARDLGDEEGVDEAISYSLDRLATLRPENLVVILERGTRAIETDDRATATASFLRVRELLWGAPEIAERALDMALDALEGDDLAAVRVPAARLSNVLKVTPMYQQSQRELVTGIQGVPIARFAAEPAPETFGDPVDVRFKAQRLSDRPTLGRSLVVLDSSATAGTDDASREQEASEAEAQPASTTSRSVARLVADGLEVRAVSPTMTEANGNVVGPEPPINTASVVAFDVGNDGGHDLFALAPDSIVAWSVDDSQSASPANVNDFGLAGRGASTATALDFDIEGDLDLLLAGGESATDRLDLLRNNLATPLESVGSRALPSSVGSIAFSSSVASDFDRDGDLDLALGSDQGIVLLGNLRQGEFTDLSEARGLHLRDSGVSDLVSADLDNDGYPELIVGGPDGLEIWWNRKDTFDAGSPIASTDVRSITALDADNDGRLDIATAGADGIVVLGQTTEGAWRSLPVENQDGEVNDLVAVDHDGDGDLDLVASGPSGLWLLDNEGGNANGWLQVRLRGLVQGNSKNNLRGVGSTVEVRSGSGYQFREATGTSVHFGLGSLGTSQRADLLRIVWTNGVPQNRLAPEPNQLVVEEQLLKGSCPFLYAWNGERFDFVTDLLWGAPIGLPAAPGVWIGADPEELVAIPGTVPVDGTYRLRITEELWEAAYFDLVRLWVVDHPAEAEVAGSLRILPGRSLPEEVFASRDLRAPVAAWDGSGQLVTERITTRDEIYADGYDASRYQGVAEREWTFGFDLGAAPAQSIRLHLDGWIFPADASLNLAVAQRSDLGAPPPRLEVQTERGWQVLMPSMGFPAGKTKTMVIDTPPLPPGASRLRIVSGQWLAWDRIAWTDRTADDDVQLVAKLLPELADLRFRGFSAPVRLAPNAPHSFDYDRVSTKNPWLPFPGRYTRYGDTRELLAASDSRLVILAAGDEIVLEFDAKQLPPIAPGRRRTVFLESHGWDKDADRNTYAAHSVEPLPFRGMSGYPYAEGESYPEELETYRREWLTREVTAPEVHRRAASTEPRR